MTPIHARAPGLRFARTKWFDNESIVILPMKKPSRHCAPAGQTEPSDRKLQSRLGQRHGTSKSPRRSWWRKEQDSRRRPRLSREVAVLYEDDAVIVLNKPAGLLAVPIKGSDVPSALSLLIAELKPRRQRALIVHRIDRFASGILLFAKTDRDRDTLIRQFLAHTPVTKISGGGARPAQRRIRHAGALFPARRHVSAVADGARS